MKFTRAAVLLATAISLSACTSPPVAPEVSGTAAVPAGLESFYGQRLDWTDCGDGQCASLEVPIDYDDPDGESTELAVYRHQGKSERFGSLVVNPGGPGASGITYAKQLVTAAPALLSGYDIVGFDPRGIGASDALSCVDGPGMDAYLSVDTTPDDQGEIEALDRANRDFSAGCQDDDPSLLENMSTPDSARDLDILRDALGDRALNFLGSSYGSVMGVSYLEQFGDNAGRIVLNGAIDPKMTGDDVAAGQARGFDRAAANYAAHCAKDDDCPLGTDPDKGVEKLAAIIEKLDSEPIRTSNGTGLLNDSWATYGTAQALYSRQMWPNLTDALHEIEEGRGETMMRLATMYAGRSENGTYSTNVLQVINAVSCLDRGPDGDISHVETFAADLAAESPLFGRFTAWSRLVCNSWPVEPVWEAGPAKVSAEVPVLVVGTTGDPATPLEWSQSLAQQLPGGILVTRNGEGHTGYRMGNRCVDAAVDDFLLRGETPKDVSC